MAPFRGRSLVCTSIATAHRITQLRVSARSRAPPLPSKKKVSLASPPVPPVPACRGAFRSPISLPPRWEIRLRTLEPASPPSPEAPPPSVPPVHFCSGPGSSFRC